MVIKILLGLCLIIVFVQYENLRSKRHSDLGQNSLPLYGGFGNLTGTDRVRAGLKRYQSAPLLSFSVLNSACSSTGSNEMPPKETKPHVTWTTDSTYDFLLMLSTMYKPEHGTHPTSRTYSAISRELTEKHEDEYDIHSLKSNFHRMRNDYKSYLLVQNHTGLGWDEATQTVNFPLELKQHFIANNKDAAKIIKHGLPNVELYEIIFAYTTATGIMAMASCGVRLDSDDSDQQLEDVTIMTGPHSGEKRPCMSETTTRKGRKKGKAVVVGDESVNNLVSLMSKNQEMKIAHKEAWFEKHKATPDTSSTHSDPYRPVACMEIVQSLDLSIDLKVLALDHVMGLSASLQKCFVLMDPTLRVAWLMKHIS